jgi:hypothetical protein
MKPPSFLLKSNPTPTAKQRLYNGRKLQVWEGRLKVDDILGWVDNPRIDLAKKLFQDKVGSRDLSQDEILGIMKGEPDFKLKELRDDIQKNGLREPVTLSFSGKLLDGNRRFFAIKYALETIPATDPNRADLEVIDAFVLFEDVSEADEENVLVEENFAGSLKIEWPDYVKAQKVLRLKDEGLTDEEVAKRLAWAKSRVKETIRIAEIIDEFEAYAAAVKNPADERASGLGLTEHEAKALAAKNYQFFNEAQKSFYNPLMTDVDFKLAFFKWIAEGKFSSFPEVRIAYKAFKNPEAMALLSGDQPGAAKVAKASLDYNERVVKNSEEVAGRIDAFVKFLKHLEADSIRKMPAVTRANLQEALELIAKMSAAVSSVDEG